jgi:hypothetical protein
MVAVSWAQLGVCTVLWFWLNLEQKCTPRGMQKGLSSGMEIVGFRIWRLYFSVCFNSQDNKLLYVANYNIRDPNINLNNVSDNWQEKCRKLFKSDVGFSKCIVARMWRLYIWRVLEWQLYLLDRTQLHTITVYTLFTTVHYNTCRVSSLCLRWLPVFQYLTQLAVQDWLTDWLTDWRSARILTPLQLTRLEWPGSHSKTDWTTTTPAKSVTLRPTTSRSASPGFEPHVGLVTGH